MPGSSLPVRRKSDSGVRVWPGRKSFCTVGVSVRGPAGNGWLIQIRIVYGVHLQRDNYKNEGREVITIVREPGAMKGGGGVTTTLRSEGPRQWRGYQERERKEPKRAGHLLPRDSASPG